MKVNVLAVLVVAGATSFLMSMENEKNYFKVSPGGNIPYTSSMGLESLCESASKVLEQGCDDAQKYGKGRVLFTLDEKQVLAKISAVRMEGYEHVRPGYIVKIKPWNKDELPDVSLLSDFPDMKRCRKLTFILSSECCIKTATIKTTEFVPMNSVSIDNIVGKNLFDLSPFKDSEFRVSLYNFLKNQRTYRERVTLQDKTFLAKYAVIEGYPLQDIYLKLKAMDNL
jgi:hypothetical protein